MSNVLNNADINLYKAFLFGDNSAFDKLIIKYRLNLIKFLMNYVNNVESAEDIAQDSFMYMIINKKEYDFKYSFKTYLYTIAKSRAINYLKYRKIESSVDDEKIEIFDVDNRIEDLMEIKEESQMVTNAIHKLKPDYQRVLYLYYFEELKYKEISQILNISMSKTKMQINRAKKQLKELLKGGGY